LRISGPLLDRIDIHIKVPRLQHEELLGRPQGEPSATIRARVVQARKLQQARFANERRPLNANRAMEAGQIRQFCPVDGEVKDLLRSAIQQLGLSARAYHCILKLSRTIADQGSRPATGPMGGSGRRGDRRAARGGSDPVSHAGPAAVGVRI
jgi:magnesium chelatase family protein